MRLIFSTCLHFNGIQFGVGMPLSFTSFRFFTYCILRCSTSNNRLAHKHETQINDRYLCANTCISPKHWRTHAARAHAAVHIHSFRNLLVFVSLLVFFLLSFFFILFAFCIYRHGCGECDPISYPLDVIQSSMWCHPFSEFGQMMWKELKWNVIKNNRKTCKTIIQMDACDGNSLAVSYYTHWSVSMGLRFAHSRKYIDIML